MENLLKVERTDFTTGDKEIYSLDDAVEKLKGYWKEECIIPELIAGNILLTPYAEYKIKQEN